MSEQPGVPLDWVPEPYRAALQEAAVTFRARLQLPPDAPVRVILPPILIPPEGQSAEVILFADGSFVTAEDEGFIDFGFSDD